MQVIQDELLLEPLALGSEVLVQCLQASVRTTPLRSKYGPHIYLVLIALAHLIGV